MKAIPNFDPEVVICPPVSIFSFYFSPGVEQAINKRSPVSMFEIYCIKYRVVPLLAHIMLFHPNLVGDIKNINGICLRAAVCH